MPCSRPTKYCRFKDCRNTTVVCGKSFFRFPKDEKRCQLWVMASKNPRLQGIPAEKLYGNAVACSDHFQDWCFMNVSQKTRLVHNAVPDSPKPKTLRTTAPYIEHILPDKSCDDFEESNPAECPTETESMPEEQTTKNSAELSFINTDLNTITVPSRHPVSSSPMYSMSADSPVTIVSVQSLSVAVATHVSGSTNGTVSEVPSLACPKSNRVHNSFSTSKSTSISLKRMSYAGKVSLFSELKRLRKSNRWLRKRVRMLENRLMMSK